MDQTEKFKELITRYLDNSISNQELEDLTRWLKKDKSHFDFFIEIKDIWDSAEMLGFPEQETEKAWKSLQQSMEREAPSFKNPVKLRRVVLQMAATLLLATGLAFAFQWLKRSDTVIAIPEVKYTQITVPIGHRSQVILPDGTKIWLNSNSYLRYPTIFEGKSREVYLNGEAYLEVAKDPQKPFTVQTATVDAYVLGTSFNIKSYNTENTFEATLVEGSLKIKPAARAKSNFREVTLKPNEKAVFVKNENKLLVEDLNNIPSESTGERHEKLEPGTQISPIESIISWKDNELIFKNETLEEMCLKMERWYGISIIIEDDRLKTNRYSGKFVYHEPINQVMDILKRTTPMEYTFERNVLIIKSK